MSFSSSSTLCVDSGDLTSFIEFSECISSYLEDFNEFYMKGASVEVHLSMLRVRNKKINFGALTTLLAILDRMRDFTQSAHYVEITNDPQIQSFLFDVGFYSITKNHGILKWNENTYGGFNFGKTNPSSKLFLFDDGTFKSLLEEDLEYRIRYNKKVIYHLKDILRVRIAKYIDLVCGKVFNFKNEYFNLKQDLKSPVIVALAELVINSHIHGMANASLGIQRSGSGISACVADCGLGLKSSLIKKRGYESRGDEDDSYFCVLASVYNKKCFGLYDAISSIIMCGGYVTVSSGCGTIVWNIDNWLLAIEKVKKKDLSIHAIARDIYESQNALKNKFFPNTRSGSKVNDGLINHNFCIRGTRVMFEIPTHK